MKLIEVTALTKTYGSIKALDNVTFSFEENGICGLLGRNGAGKTTLMSILTSQEYPTTGQVEVLGAVPYENVSVMSKLCFIRENQKYPGEATVQTVMKSAPWFYPAWNEDLCEQLLGYFDVPQKSQVNKLSRGQLSAVAATLGLSSRAPITFFDEPYLGLDAQSRRVFYDALARDYEEHPRLVILSSHLIDEIANLIDRVLLLDHGKLVLDKSADEIRDFAFEVTGPTALVMAFIENAQVIKQETLGGVSRVTVFRDFGEADFDRARSQRLDVGQASLQDIMMGLSKSIDEIGVNA